jgi:uncharacterized protein
VFNKSTLSDLECMPRSPKSNTADLSIRANNEAEAGNSKAGFRVYLAAAKARDTCCQINLGYLYEEGCGVQRNRSAAMYWYERAYRRDGPCAAYNIAAMWRNDGKYRRALKWFKRAVRLGDDEANLEIAKDYHQVEHNPLKAIRHLEKLCASNCVTEAGLEEARTLLRRTRKSAELLAGQK